MFARLLVAVDLRESRHRLVGTVARLAGEHRSFVRVLHVVEFVGRGATAPLEERSEAERLVERAVFDLRMAGVPSDGLCRSAVRRDVSSLIVDDADRFEADAIVMGANHRRGLSRRLGGGVREGVIRRTSIPVLVAPVALPLVPLEPPTQLGVQ
jgi:nucleotide-binding universal stress UspA family protein